MATITCFVCNGTRHHDMMYDIVIGDRIIYFGKTCHDEILTQYVKDWEQQDAAMTERMNRHEAEQKEESMENAYILLTELMRMHKGMTIAWRKLLHARNHVKRLQLKERF